MQPIWSENGEEKIYGTQKIKILLNTIFLVNERFSYSSDFGIMINTDSENFLYQCGIAHQPKPNYEIRVSFLNIYNGIAWNSSIGIAFTIIRERRSINQ